MAATEIKYRLNALLADNTLTVDNKSDKIAVVVSAGTADKQRLISEIMDTNPGLERETIEAVINMEQRAIKRLILSGFRVNTGLFSVAARLTGVIENNAWDRERNGIYADFTQGTDLRESINETSVNIIGEKGNAMYVSGGEDASTRVPGFDATPGCPYTLMGAKLKIEGPDPSVGITLTDSKGKVTRIARDMIAVNMPSRLVFIIPSGLADGTYQLTVTTQYAGTALLKAPRSVSLSLAIGENSGGSTTPPSGGSGSETENPLG